MNDKKILNENNESFVMLYTKLYNENFEELENLRKKEASKALKIIGPILALFVIMIFCPFLIFALMPIYIIYIVICILKSSKKNINNKEKASYREVFKEKVITPIIKNAIPGCEFFPDEGISKVEYAKGKWESYDLFHSEDKLIIPIKIEEGINFNTGLEIAEVHTQNREEDSEGKVSYVTVFHGMAGFVSLPKDINAEIKVVKNRIWQSKLSRVKMDMTEFEKMFDVEGTDAIKVMQILTADVMTDMIDIVKTTKIQFEFYLKNNMMYIRFHTNALFEPDLFNKAMQLDKLKKYFDITTMLSKVTTSICKVVADIEL